MPRIVKIVQRTGLLASIAGPRHTGPVGRDVRTRSVSRSRKTPLPANCDVAPSNAVLPTSPDADLSAGWTSTAMRDADEAGCTSGDDHVIVPERSWQPTPRVRWIDHGAAAFSPGELIEPAADSMVLNRLVRSIRETR